MKIHEAEEWFTNRGAVKTADYRDSAGRFAFEVELPDAPDPLVVSCVRQTHRGKGEEAAAMEKLLRTAEDRDALVALFVGDAERPKVWAPEVVLSKGEEDTITDERRRKGETWITLPLDVGITLSGYVDGVADPRRHLSKLTDFK